MMLPEETFKDSFHESTRLWEDKGRRWGASLVFSSVAGQGPTMENRLMKVNSWLQAWSGQKGLGC